MRDLDLTAYAGRWVALWQERVAGFGTTPDAALTLARHNQPKDRFTLRFVEVSDGTPLLLPALLERLRPFFFDQTQPVYLVGGAVRDILLERPSHDLDFAVPRHAIQLAFRVGDTFGWPAYVLDHERDTGRVVLPDQKSTLDFARFRGETVEADLRDRDFTINAMALPATARYRESVIDPLDGRDALNDSIISLTHPKAIDTDPIRALRAIRQQMQYGFALDLETARAVAAAQLDDVSVERIRDETIKLLRTATPHRALKLLYKYNLLNAVSPQLAAHFSDPAQRNSTLDRLAQGVRLTALLRDEQEQNSEMGTLTVFRPGLVKQWQREADGGIEGALLFLLGLLFASLPRDETAASLRRLALSNEVVDTVTRIVQYQSRIDALPLGDHLSRRVIYRYFRETGPAGIEIGLLGLARWLAAPADERAGSLDDQVNRLRQLFYAYFEQHDTVIEPKLLVNGRELMRHFRLDPGPEVGRLLRLIKEEQAAGQIHTAEEAIRFTQTILA